ncbi:MAG TPA: GAF domain-containing protein, partial [Vicinamibacterales bacterium]
RPYPMIGSPYWTRSSAARRPLCNGRATSSFEFDGELAHVRAYTAFLVANFRALRERTTEHTRSVAELLAQEEVMGAANSSLDRDTVPDTIISRAAQLSQADEGTIYAFNAIGEVFVPEATLGTSAERVEWLRDRRVRLGETHLGQAAVLRAPVNIEDMQQDPAIADAGSVRHRLHAVLAVPLRCDEHGARRRRRGSTSRWSRPRFDGGFCRAVSAGGHSRHAEPDRQRVLCRTQPCQPDHGQVPRARAAAEGTGLGPSLSYDIVVKQHGGQLHVDSQTDTFTEFVITLPRRMPASDGGRA